jgi:hypothetical protein
MPLALAVIDLKADIKAAYKAAKDTAHSTSNGAGDQSAEAADPIIETLGNAIGAAIHKYAMKADVNIGPVVSTQAPGVMVLTAGSPVVHIGSTVMPIITVHAGFGKLQ